MSKKKHPNEEIIKGDEPYEKLRDELFHYRIEILSFKKTIKTIVACVSIVLAILGYFGYDKIDSLVKEIEIQTNTRLAKTDSLLSKVDTHYLDSLTALVNERTALYEEACTQLEKGMEANRDLFRVIISNMDYNVRSNKKIESYFGESGGDLFDVVFYSNPVKANSKSDCYAVMSDNVVLNEDDVFLTIVRPKGRRIAIYYQLFEIKGKYNKLPFVVDKYEQYQEYELEVILVKKKGTKCIGYSQTFPITMN